MAPRDDRLGPQPDPGWWVGRAGEDGGPWRDPGPTRHDTFLEARAALWSLSIEDGEHAVIAWERAAPDDPTARVLTEWVWLSLPGDFVLIARRGPVRVCYGPPGGFA